MREYKYNGERFTTCLKREINVRPDQNKQDFVTKQGQN